MAGTFRCTIVTPTEAVFDGEVVYASFPAWDGQYGVLPGMSPVLGQLGIGPLRLDLSSGDPRWFLLEGGFAQVRDDVLTLLTEGATPAESISVTEARAELAEAEASEATDPDQREGIARARRVARARVALSRDA